MIPCLAKQNLLAVSVQTSAVVTAGLHSFRLTGLGTSRGYGRLQRTLLDLLENSDELLDTFRLTALAFGCQPDADGRTLFSEAQVVSARRALARLAREGRIFALGRPHMSSPH
jgi:hypothetical protein